MHDFYSEKNILQKELSCPTGTKGTSFCAPWESTQVVGRRRPRVDGYERVSGSAVYPSDVVLPGMIYAAVLHCPHPHARIKNIDIQKARSVSGVKAILTKDSPEADIQWPYADNFQGPLFGTHCRYEGEIVAAVAAVSPDQAQDALRRIEVSYEVLPFVSDERKALDKGAPKVHSGGNLVQPVQNYERGNITQGFAQAEVILERSFRTQALLHTPLELHGAVANWDGNMLTVWESTQGVYAVQDKVASVLNMPKSKVRVIGHYMGGGFGSKLETSKYSVIAALLARKTAKPVKLFHTREQTYLAMGNRPASTMSIKIGADRKGHLTAIEFQGLGASGAYSAGGTSLLDWLARDMYQCPNVRTELKDVYINAGPARPFRAPGYPQGSWAVEQIMDELAEELDMDPVELRLKNFASTSQGREGNPPYTTNGLKDCLRKGSEAFGWKQAGKKKTQARGREHLRRGVGMAACSWFVGGGWPPSTVILKLFADGSLNLNMGASDIGTGTKTAMALIAAEELQMNPDQIQIENADTGTTQYASPSGGSKTVPTEGPAVREAALNLKAQLLAMAEDALGHPADDLELVKDAVQVKGNTQNRVKFTELPGLKEQQVILGIGHKAPNPQDKAITPFGAQFCEVEVNTNTGEVRILRFVAAHESGRVLDRLTFDSQVIGGVTMGVGLGTTEFRVLDANHTGKLCNRNWHDYKLPTMLDVPPEITSVAIDLPDSEANITGAKGLGEPVTVPTASAIANAIYNAVGVRMEETPINPVTLLGRLNQGG
jgi:xanthine dehydrogenase YagR molybdenum-binding subunit